MKCYKVCEIVDGVMRSYLNKESGIKYEIGEVTTPEEGYGPLCGFTKLNYAIRFWCVVPHNHIILECEYTPSSEESAWSTCHKRYIEYMPPGTILCSSITPIRIVKGG